MSTKSARQFLVRCSLVFAFVLSPMLLATASMVVDQGAAEASSHREAPLISQDQYADNTDTYVFVSPTNPDNLVLVASWIPFEGPEGGPNYYEWGKGVYYEIHVDNNGDAVADYTYTLTSTVEVQNPLTFLYNVAPIGGNGENWNRQQRISVMETSGAGSKTLLDNVLAPPVNIGSKSTDNYDQLEDNFIYDVSDEGDDLTIYAGQTDDAFWVDLQVFDLLTLRGQAPPIGYAKGNNDPVDSVSGFNVHSLVIEVPISRLTQGDEPVLGVWATASRPAMRVLNGPAGLGTLDNSGEPVQVSRLGMPLVNEVVLPYALKDAFNSIPPSTDLALYTGGGGAQIQEILQKSVEDPEIGRLLCALYGVPLPGDGDDNCSTEVTVGTPRSGRGDIFDIFLTGIVLANEFTIQTQNGPVTLPAGFNVNQPANVVPAEMIRINTTIKGELCSPTPSRLGILGGDACGFPNGRRLADDTVEIELLAVAGAAYGVLDGRDSDFSFNADLIGVLDDGIDANDRPFRSGFPYMALAQSGQEHIHDNPMGGTVPPVPTPTATPTPPTCDPTADNVVENGGFEMGRDPWKFYSNGRGNFTVTSPGHECEQAARVQINQPGNNVQFYQAGLTLEPNTQYRLRFAAYSSTGRDLALYVHKHGAPYTNYGLSMQQVNLETGWQEYEVEFTTSGFASTVNDGRLRFWLAPFAKAGDVYWIDDVRLQKVEDSAAASSAALRPTRLAGGELVIDVPAAEFDPAVAATMAEGNAVDAADTTQYLPFVTN